MNIGASAGTHHIFSPFFPQRCPCSLSVSLSISFCLSSVSWTLVLSHSVFSLQLKYCDFLFSFVLFFCELVGALLYVPVRQWGGFSTLPARTVGEGFTRRFDTVTSAIMLLASRTSPPDHMYCSASVYSSKWRLFAGLLVFFLFVCFTNNNLNNKNTLINKHCRERHKGHVILGISNTKPLIPCNPALLHSGCLKRWACEGLVSVLKVTSKGGSYWVVFFLELCNCCQLSHFAMQKKHSGIKSPPPPPGPVL